IDGTAAVTQITDTINDTTLDLAVDKSTLTEAGGTLVYTATLSNAAGSDVSIQLSNGQIITIDAGETQSSVEFTVAGDEDAILDASSVTASIASLDSVTGGNFENLVLGTSEATTQITDTIDTTELGMSVDTSNLLFGIVTVDFNLTNAGDSDVVITLASGEEITIEAGEQSASTTIQVNTGNDYFTAQIVSISGGNFENLQLPEAIEVRLHDAPIIQVSDENSEASGHITVDEAGIGNESSSNIASGSITISTTANIANITIGDESVSLLELVGLTLNPISIELPNGQMTLTNYNAVTGELSYEYQLTSSLDHEDADSLIENVQINVTDINQQASSADLAIQVLDDQPSFTINQPDTIDFKTMDHNIIFAIDISGSMDSELGDTTILQATIDGITQLLNKYEKMGNVQVKLVPFSTNATESEWANINEATSLLEGLNAGGTTDYDDPLAAIVDNYSTPQDANTKVYFISDGNPYGASENEDNVSAITNYQQTWKDFIETNNVDVEVIGIGSAVQYQYLNMVGAPTETLTNDSGNYVAAENVVSVDTANELVDALLATVGGKSVGEIGSLQNNVGVIDFGADSEGSISFVTIDGVDYSPESEQVTDNILTVTTENGATVKFNFATGQYEYDVSISAEENADESSTSWSKVELGDDVTQWVLTESITITVKDGDGDTASGQLTLTTRFPENAPEILPELQDDLAQIDELDGTVASYMSKAQITGNVIDNDTLTQTNKPIVGVTTGNGIVSEGNVGLVLTGLYGSLVLQDNGSYVYTLDNTNNAVNSLNDGDSLSETFSYLVQDANGNYDSAVLNIQINGVTDELPDLSENAAYGFNGNDIIYAFLDRMVIGSFGSYKDPLDPDGIQGFHTFNKDEIADAGFGLSRIAGSTMVATGYTAYNVNEGATLIGGEGADFIAGGSGDDVIIGGSNGNGESGLVSNVYAGDVMSGGEGDDMFVWLAGDDIDKGFADPINSPDVATDYITDFSGGDSLNLADLLQGENHDNLDSYLNFEVVDGDTIISVSKDGDFTGDSSDQHKADMKIVLENTDLTIETNGTDADIIRKLLEDNQLITNNNNNF
ncbi:ferredoxin-dependent glutamate synthase, partial [Catenovulum agarivorans DS-2]